MTDEELFELGWLDPNRIRPAQRMALAVNTVTTTAMEVAAAHGVRVVVVVLPPTEVNGERAKLSVSGSGSDAGQAMVEAAAHLMVLVAMGAK